MKTLFLNFLLLLFLQNACCQVAGKFTTANAQPIPFANVLLLNSKDSSLVKAILTNEEGAYRFENILEGTYILRFNNINYTTWDSPIFEITPLQKNNYLGSQVVKENAKELDAVVVRADKPLFRQQVDGMIVNVENSILTKGSSALEVLERSPGVIIDRRNNSIALNGKTGVMVMLNGKMMPMPIEQVVTLLNSMSADDIEKIELLTNPPAKYDAAGNAGLINIVLKKNKKQGTNGTVSLTAGYGRGEKGTGSVNISRNTKDLNLYGSYTFSHNNTYSDMYITSTQNMPFLGGQVSVIFLDTTKLRRNNHDATLGLDLKINSKTSVGGSVTFNGSSTSATNITNAAYNILPDSLLQYNGINKGVNRWSSLVNTVYFEKQVKEGEKINFNVDYLYFNNDAHSEVQSSFIDKHGLQAGNSDTLFSPGQKGFANTTIQVGVVKLDHTKQVSKKVKLETGAKATYTQSSSLSGIKSLVNGAWTSSPQTSNNIVMKEGIGALYASVNAQINASVNLATGVRYEYSYTDMDDPKTGRSIVNRKLAAIFPSLFLSKKINDKSELQLSYTKRIGRPSYNDLASYVGYSDPTAVYTGNPFLRPTVTNNLKLGYAYKSYSFSVLFSRDKDAIARYQLTESSAADILFISPQNLVRQDYITFQTNVPVKVNNWWTMNYGFTGGSRQLKVDYTKHHFEKKYFAYSFNFSQAFKLPHNFSAELSGWYNSRFYNGTVKIDGYGLLNVGIKKELINNRGIFQLAVSDLLRNERINVYYGTLTEEAFSIKSHVAINTESRKFPIIRLTYSRPFGSGTIKDQRKESGSSRDERDRVRKD